MKKLTFKRFTILLAIATIAPFMLHAQNYNFGVNGSSNQDRSRPDNIKDEEICMQDMLPIEFNVKEKYSNEVSRLDGFSMPIVGDLNGDGKPEIIALGLRDNNDGFDLQAFARYLIVYNGQTGREILKFDLRGSEVGATEAGFKLRYETRHNGPSKFAMADLDGQKGAEIVVTETVSGRVYALKPTYSGGTLTGFSKLWEVTVSHKSPILTGSLLNFSSPMPYISDINGDGIPEVIVYNKIYSGRNGALLLELETLNRFARPINQDNLTGINGILTKKYAYVGRRPGTPYADDAIPAMAIIDIDDDGIMEIIAGSKVYKPTIAPNSTSTSGNSFTIINGPQSVTLPRASGAGTNTYYLSDGYTAVADIDGDGNLDIIVQTSATDNYDQEYRPLIYVWDLVNPTEVKAAISFKARSLTGTMSMPFIGDINGRKDDYTGAKSLPEICFNTGIIYDNVASGSPLSYHPLSSGDISTNKRFNGTAELGAGTNYIFGHIVGFTYHANPNGSTPIHERLKMSWVMEHGDESACTGITMFDFDADGVKELVYRDEISLRVISPARKTYIPKNEPVDAINGAIRFKRTGFYSYTGFEAPVIADVNGDGSADLLTFAHTRTGNLSYGNLFVFEANGESWAPSRPVWNQGIYYPLQINDDLTVPRNPISTLTKFVSQRPGQSTVDTIQPFNANWVQQPIVRVGNYVPITFTPDLALENIQLVSWGTNMGVDSMVVRLTIENRGKNTANTNTPIIFYHTVVNSNTKLGKTVIPSGIDIYPGERVELDYTIPCNPVGKMIHARLVDDGTNVFPAAGFQDCDPTNNYGFTAMVKATNDYYVTYDQYLAKFDITANDTAPCKLLPEIVEPPKFGTAEIAADSTLSYIVDYEFQGKDSLRYAIKCERNGIVTTDTAYVYFTVSSKPDNIITDPGECIVPFKEIDFTVKQKWVSTSGTAHRMSSTLVGDLDGDGIAEIAVYGNVDNGNNNINIFDGRDGTLKAQIPITSIQQVSGWRPAMIAVMVDADRNGLGEIIVARSDLKIMSYEADLSGGTFKMTPKWTATRSYTPLSGTDRLPHPNVADLNGDGVPELIIYNQLYNAATGAHLGETEPIETAYFGRIPQQNGNKSSNFQSTVDIDGDGILEIIAGGKVYKPTFNEGNTAVTCSILYENATIGDGFTSVADVDLDGTLDVVVAKAINTTSTYLYVWSPVKNMMIDNFQIAAKGGFNGVSFPFIGDIDGTIDPVTGKKYPEICVNSVGMVFAYKYDSGTGKYVTKWKLTTSDQSGATGITLFDFNNSGVSDLVYRDESTIRIIDGSLDNNPKQRASFACASSTSFEYPSIADVDGDGSANICVTCNPYLAVYESGTQPWAPTRKVWNQVNYDPLLINDDLTVPAYSIPKNTVFTVAGVEHRPYNGAFIQVPIVDINMKPVVKAADPFIANATLELLNATTVRVSVTIGNQGQVNVNSSLPISLYGNSINAFNLIKTIAINETLQPGSTVTLTYEIPLADIKPTMIIRLQDDGTTYPALGSFTDCNMDNNTFSIQSFMAMEDYASPEKNKSILIDVLENDILGSCTSTTVTIEVATTPTSGTAVLEGNKIKYTPNSGFVGTDSFTYKITCDAIESTATVNIIVNSTLMVETISHASEPNNPGIFRIKFTDNGFTFPKDLEIFYTVSHTETDTEEYVVNPASSAIIRAGESSVDVTVTPSDNFKVEGSGKQIVLAITSAAILDTP